VCASAIRLPQWWPVISLAPDVHPDRYDAMATSERPRLELVDVVSTYEEAGRHLTALAGLSLSVGVAEFVALVGPSGSGKSTALDIIAGLLDPDGGAVLLNGEATCAAQRIGRSAYMQQRDLLLPWRTALSNAALGLEASGMPRADAERMAAAQLDRFGLGGFGDAFPGQLSGGMRQRTALLRTILPHKELILFDEPFGALDALTRADLQMWLAALWEQERISVLLVTHDVEEAVFLADRVLVLTARPGRVAGELKVSLPRPRTRSMIASPEFIADRATLLSALGILDVHAL
jgi:ABC-type nitrate/sulfonate/bicarbonate transport system ATPase subunit